MYKKFLFAIVAMLAISSGASAETHSKAPAKAPAKSAGKVAEKQAPKDTVSEDEKYAIVYDKCIKEAEKDEPKYDQIFNSCMDKNGFPQEEYEMGGESMGNIENQDD